MPYGTPLRYRLAILAVGLPLAVNAVAHYLQDLAGVLSGAPQHRHELAVEIRPFPQLRIVANDNRQVNVLVMRVEEEGACRPGMCRGSVA